MLFSNDPVVMDSQTVSVKFSFCIKSHAWKDAAFIPSSCQTDLSAICSGPSSCLDVH